jgi:ABC-type antimicrobial peptide transport system permease subunit
VSAANLLLTSAAARSGKIGVCLAIDDGRSRLVRQLTTKSVFLALLGAGLGIVLSYYHFRKCHAAMESTIYFRDL